MENNSISLNRLQQNWFRLGSTTYPHVKSQNSSSASYKTKLVHYSHSQSQTLTIAIEKRDNSGQILAAARLNLLLTL